MLPRLSCNEMRCDIMANMQLTATLFKLLSYFGLMTGLILPFWDMRFAAIAFLFSIACAHLAEVIRSDKHQSDMHETLSVLLELCNQTSKKSQEIATSSEPPRMPGSP